MSALSLSLSKDERLAPEGLSPFDVAQGDPELAEESKDESDSWFDRLTTSDCS